MELIGKGKHRNYIGSNKGLYSSTEDLYREYWNSEENAKRADDYIARLNAFTASIGEKAGGLTGGYGDRAIYNSFDKDELASLEKEYNDFMRPFLKYSNSENAAKLDEQILGTLSGAVDAQTAFAQGAKEWSVYKNEADYDNQQENARVYFDIYEMTNEEYEEYKESVKSDTAYGALEKSYKKYNSLYWYLENPEDNPRPDWYKGKSPDEMTSDEWRSAKEEAAREMYSYEEAMERARPAYEGKIERANAIREQALRDHAYNATIEKWTKAVTEPLWKTQSISPNYKSNRETFEEFSKTFDPETYDWEEAVNNALKKYGQSVMDSPSDYIIASDLNASDTEKLDAAINSLNQFKDEYFTETQRSTLSKEEQALLAYLEKYSPTEAKMFYRDIEPHLEERAYSIEQQKISELTSDDPNTANLMSIVANLGSGAGYIEQIGRTILGDKAQELGLKDRDSYTYLGDFRDVVRSTRYQDILDSTDSKFLGMGYQALMSQLDQGASLLLGFGLSSGASFESASKAALALMGTQAASSATSAALERGTEPWKAILIGGAAGTIEYLTEKLPLENLAKTLKKGTSGFKELLLTTLVQGGTEAIEEGVSNIGGTIAEFIIDPENASIIERARELLLDGSSFEEAMEQAFVEWGVELGNDAFVGFLSGAGSNFVLGSANSIIKKMSGARPFNKSELKTPTVSATGTITFNDKTVEIDSVASSDKSDITFNLKDGQTAKASELAFENKNTAELMTWLAGNFEDNQIFGIYERYKDLGAKMNPAAFARGWSLAQDYARNGKKKTDTLVKKTGLDELSFDRAYGQGKYEVKRAEKAADDLGAASLDVSYKTQRGKTIDTQVSGVASISGDTVTWKLSDGTTATTDAIKQKNSASEVLLANTANVAKSLGVPAANVYLSGFPSEGSVRAYTSAFGAIYRGAMLGYTLDQIRKGNGFSVASMSEDVQRKVYNLARQKATSYEKGKVTVEARNLTDVQKKEIAVLDRLSKKRNMTIVVVDSLGKRGLNGAYVRGDNIIYVAADNLKGSLLQVVGHEVVHYIKRWNNAGYNSLVKVTEAALKTHGVDVEARIDRIQKLHLEKLGVKLSRANATEEIVAESFSTVFLQEKAIQTLYETNEGTFRKVIEALKQFVSDLKQAIRSVLSAEARAMEKTIQQCEGIVDGFMAVLDQTKDTEGATGEAEGVKAHVSPSFYTQEEYDTKAPYSPSFSPVEQEQDVELNKSVTDVFGKTYSWNETGYLLKDGSRLDFSGRKDGAPGGYRTVDHRDIWDAYSRVDSINSDDMDGNDAMIDFMRRGNIRISPESGGINLSVAPTESQREALVRFFDREKGEVIVDIDDANGNTISSAEYDRGTSAKKILSDIDAYFASGKTREESVVRQFHFSLSDEPAKDLVKENRELKKLVEDLQAQFTLTKGKRISNTQLLRVARGIKKEYVCDVPTYEIEDALRALNNYMANAENPNAQEVFNEFGKLAEEIYNNSFITQGEAMGTPAKDILKAIRREGNILLTKDAEEEVRNTYGSLKEFRNKMLHYGLSFVSAEGNDGTWIDVAFPEIMDSFAGYIRTDDVTVADMPAVIAEALEKIEKLNEPVNTFDVDGVSKADAVSMITADILGQFMEAPDFRTFADRKQEEFDRASRSYNKRLNQQRTSYETAKVRRQLENSIKRLNTLLDSERLSSRAKEDARGFLEITRELLQMGHSKEKIDNLVGKAIREAKQAFEKNGSNLKELKFDVTGFFADPVAEFEIAVSDSDMLGDLLAGKSISSLTKYELEQLLRFVNAMEAASRLTTKMFTFKKQKSLEEVAADISSDVASTYKSEKKHLAQDNRFSSLMRKYETNFVLDPYRLGERLGSEMFSLMKTLTDGENEYARFEQEQVSKMLNLIKEYKMEHLLQTKKFGVVSFNDPYSDKNKVTLTIDGQKVEMAREELMSLYAGKKNEMIDGKTYHYSEGGFRLADKRKGQMKHVTVSDEAFAVIQKALTENERAFVDRAVEILTGMAEAGNEVSKRMSGVQRFMQKYYFPIHTDPTGRSQDVNKHGKEPENRVASPASSKARQKGASNPVIIAPFMATWANSVKTMGMYVALAERMSDTIRVWNTGDVKDTIRRTYGQEFNDAIAALLRDVNGSTNASNLDGFLSRGLTIFRRNAVAGNLSVIAQQATSIPRAFAYINPKYFSNAESFSILHGVKAFNEAKEFIDVYLIKDNGSFDVGIAKSLEERLRDGGGLASSSVFSIPAEVMDKYAWGAIYQAVVKEAAETNPELQKGTESWKKHISERVTDIIRRSQVYDSIFVKPEALRSKNVALKSIMSFMSEPVKMLNMLYEAYIKMQRGEKGAWKIIAAVQAASVMNILVKNLVYALRDKDEYEEDEAGRLKEKSFLEKYFERVVSWDSLLDLTHIGDFPLASLAEDVWRAANGRYGSANPSIDFLVDIVSRTKRAIENPGAGTIFEAVSTFADTIGVPASNIYRDLMAIYRNTIGKVVGGEDFSTKSKASYALYLSMFDDTYEEVREDLIEQYSDKEDPESYVDKLLVDALKIYDERVINGAIAYAEGDSHGYNSAIDDLVSDGFSEELAIKAIQSAADSYSSEIKKAAKANEEADDAETNKEKRSAEREREKIIERLVSLGYDRDEIEADIDSAEVKNRDSDESSSEESVSRYSYKMVVSALENENYDSFEKIKSEIIEEKIEEYMKKDKSLTKKEAKSKAESAIRSSITSAYKDDYVTGTESERKEIREILAKTGLYSKLNKTLKDWDDDYKKK